MQFRHYYESILAKTLKQLTLKELAFIHLNGRDSNEIKGGRLLSALPVVIREIRHAKHQAYSRNFLPLAAAFTILDQIGFCYSRNDIPAFKNPKASSIKKSLYYFCGFAENDKNTKSLYGLRNSFLHTSSLLSKGTKPSHPNFNFVFDSNLSAMIKHPKVEWNGNFNDLKPEMSTFVNPLLIVDMVEQSVVKALELLYEDKLVISCMGGPVEFYYRFLKMVNN